MTDIITNVNILLILNQGRSLNYSVKGIFMKGKAYNLASQHCESQFAVK